jgi:2-polyprenyl-3-methyl-5-hydroxy-6-metoxy-1,4-benzoquinol methylase
MTDNSAKLASVQGVDEAVLSEYGEDYFKNYNYADRTMGKFSMYWFARRYYAALAKRYAPPQGGRLLELGCGLGHLLGLLQDDFQCVGIDLAAYSIEQTRLNAPEAEALMMSADDLSSFADAEFGVVIALHLVEHLPDPARTLRDINRILTDDGLLLFATPNPRYGLRKFKDHDTDAIGKDPTHINVQSPRTWRQWAEAANFEVVQHFGDGLWDVPYLPFIPKSIQFGVFGLPALFQVLTRTTWTPLWMGVNQICLARKTASLERNHT